MSGSPDHSWGQGAGGGGLRCLAPAVAGRNCFSSSLNYTRVRGENRPPLALHGTAGKTQASFPKCIWLHVALIYLKRLFLGATRFYFLGVTRPVPGGCCAWRRRVILTHSALSREAACQRKGLVSRGQRDRPQDWHGTEVSRLKRRCAGAGASERPWTRARGRGQAVQSHHQ